VGHLALAAGVWVGVPVRDRMCREVRLRRAIARNADLALLNVVIDRAAFGHALGLVLDREIDEQDEQFVVAGHVVHGDLRKEGRARRSAAVRRSLNGAQGNEVQTLTPPGWNRRTAS